VIVYDLFANNSIKKDHSDTMTLAPLLALAPARRAGQIHGIPSICSAHPQVIGAALALGRETGGTVLIEATCNQVNQDGGYTGMTPSDFRAFVLGIAADEGFDPADLILGGDHLGPNPWTHLPAEQAMAKARAMVAAYVQAGFGKIHLDASMACADDPTSLPDAVIAKRNASLAAVAEAQGPAGRPVYVIGTEVPIAGGATEEVEHLAVTTRQAAAETVALHRAAFAAEGIAPAFDRVVGLVVQPGVEFGNENVVPYDAVKARDLIAGLDDLPMLFEGHSTDYQTPAALAALVRDGFAILKVGPGLTFALREALYALDHIADVLFPARPRSLRATMEGVMLASPEHWAKYYSGGADHQRLQRHFSYSDRIRYYWADPVAADAVAGLVALFEGADIPQPLISQFFGPAYADVMAGNLAPTAPALLRAAVTRVLRIYGDACSGGNEDAPNRRLV
jgi:D-tagatose 6-phosphate 4-epimerase